MDTTEAKEIGNNIRTAAGLMQALLADGVPLEMLERYSRSPALRRRVTAAFAEAEGAAVAAPGVTSYHRGQVDTLIRYLLTHQGKTADRQIVGAIVDECAGDVDALNELLNLINRRPMGNRPVRFARRRTEAVVTYFGLQDGEAGRTFDQAGAIMDTTGAFVSRQVRDVAQRLWLQRVSAIYQRLASG